MEENKKEEECECLSVLIALAILVYIAAAIIAFARGINDADRAHFGSCHAPATRIGYYTGLSQINDFGCYMGKPVEEE